MPKQSIEINKFLQGIVSTPSNTDTDSNSAKYSKNIDPSTAQGRLQGIDGDKKLTTSGFKDEDLTLSNLLSIDASAMKTAVDKINSDNINLVSIEASDDNTIDKINLVSNIHGDGPVKLMLSDAVESTKDGYNMIVSDDKVLIGAGGSNTTPSKVVMHATDDRFVDNDSGDIDIFDAALIPPELEGLSGMFSEYMTFPIHGKHPSTTKISENDAGTRQPAFYADYDVALDNSSDGLGASRTLYQALNGEELDGLKVGQVFKISDDTNDFDDDAMLAWKRYDYDADATLAADDLFMFCGYIAGTDKVPILRFLGNAENIGGKPAFAYAFKDGDATLYKISLTITHDDDGGSNKAFDTTESSSTIKDAAGNAGTYAITNVGSRVTAIDLSELDGFNGNYITAISGCHSPPLFNNLNLEGSTDPHTTDTTSIYYNNGHLKYLYRHGVLYVAVRNRASTLFRVNVIDFHQLTDEKVMVDNLSLDFTKIPNQLHAEDGEGIVQRTLEDQLTPNNFDPKSSNTAWSRVPVDAYILGICETFEDGLIDSVSNNVTTWSNAAFKVTTRTSASRLASGDKVRFANMSTTAPANTAFNVDTPYEISVVDGGKSFYVVSDDATDNIPALNASYNAHWWNAKVWILYGKKTVANPFHKWDLFLYNANTLDTDATKVIYMADRTVPYHQARYYNTLRRTSDSFGDVVKRMWYPGEFVFAKHHTNSGVEIEAEHVTIPGGDIYTEGTNGQGDSTGASTFCELGVYDKSGRWTINGGPTIYAYNSDIAGQAHRTGFLNIGENLGWSIERERKVWPVKNSLHPLNPYSKLYMASELYPGYNTGTISLDLDINDLDVDSFGYRVQGESYHNRPRHAVTFIGKVDGDFVVTTPPISRARQWESAVYQLDWSSEFRVDAATFGDDETERIDTYRGDEVLFTIDDFSGHRGSCQDAYAAATDSDTPLRSGIDIGFPNWGGPEIENPKFKANGNYNDGLEEVPGAEGVVYSSTNGGYFAVAGDENDKGWEGYAPPKLFTPGSGYYVYINRTWKSTHNKCGHSTDSADTEYQQLCYEGHEYGNWLNQYWGNFENSEIGISKELGKFNNRWFNFSSTAIADNRNHVFLGASNPQGTNLNFEPYFTDEYPNNQLDITPAGGRIRQSRFYRRDFPNLTSNNVGGPYVTFGGWPSMGSGVCTMHKLEISDLGRINNISPFIHDSRVVDLVASSYTTVGDIEFFAGYLCGITTPANESRVMVLRTNLDPVYDKILKEQHVTHGDVYDARMYQKISRQGTEGTDRRMISESGTHLLEVAPITDTDTNRYNGSNGQAGNPPKLRQAAIDSNMSSVVSDGIKVLSLNTFEDNGINGVQDWMVSVNSSNNNNVYLGSEPNKFTLSYSGGNAADYSDFEGSFTSSEWTTATDSQILTTFNKFLTFTSSTETTGAPLSAGTYYYKFTFLYDDQYESPLIVGTAMSHTLTAASTTSGGTWDNIKVTFNLPDALVQSLPNRVTGIVLYRKFGGGDTDDYSLVEEIKFHDKWNYNDGYHKKTIFDTGNLGWSFESITGLSQTLENTSLNYGLSTRFQGYLYVSQAWHPELEKIENWIFRSLPDNPFSFNWTDDYVIMPEKPIAMTVFNSRLFVWGRNKLYKLDPMNLVIEDEYDGVSIVSKDSFAVTEYGLCFLDENNVYLHDGNKAQPIANDILYSSNESITHNGTSYNREKQGYRELVRETLDFGYKPKVFYSGLKNSFVILLFSTTGLALSYNINLKRWDLWDAPTPKGATTSKNGNILISDGTNLYQYLSNISAEDYAAYHQQEWDWFSNDITFGSDNQEKVFKTLSLTGTPCIYDFADSTTPAIYDSSSDTKTLSVQAFVDDEPIALTVKNKFYDTMRFGNVQLAASVGAAVADTELTIDVDINNSSTALYKRFEFIRPGHLIKIDDEIMLVTNIEYNTLAGFDINTTIKLTVIRAQMGTSKVSHSDNTAISFVAPKLKFPGGTKGNRLKLQLQKQHGFIDSINILYKPKSIK
jgi:hypothetical protein